MKFVTMVRHAREGSLGSAFLAGMCVKWSGGDAVKDCPFDSTVERALVGEFLKGFQTQQPAPHPMALPKPKPEPRLEPMPARRPPPPVQEDPYPGFVYLVGISERRKIGVTMFPQKRLNSLTNSAGEVARFVRLYRVPSRRDMRPIELALHERFKETWVLGEFFAVNEDDFDAAIKEIAAKRGCQLDREPSPPAAAASAPPWLKRNRPKG